jgi:adenine phosphoribosyltransferase
MEYYPLELCGLKRKLPLVFVGRHTQLASFSLLGDGELVEKIAGELIKKLVKIKFDYLVGPEVKVVPLVAEMARRLKQARFVICRKSVKPYMVSPVILKPLPYFPKHVRQLVLDGTDAELLKSKRVVIVDDVISTGVTMRMMGRLMEKVGAAVSAYTAVLREGKQFDELTNLITLGELPVFKNDS